MIGEAATVARGSALLFVSRIVGNAGFFVAVLVLTRALSVPHRGEFAFTTTAAQVLARLASLGITEATSVFAAREPDQRRSLLSNALLFTGASSTLVAAVFCLVLAMSHETRPLGLTNSDLGLLIAGALFSALAGAGHTFLSGCGSWKLQSLAQAISPWLYALLIAGAWTVEPLDLERSLQIWVAYYSIWAGTLLIVAARVAPPGRPSRALLRRSLHFGVRAWAGSVMSLLNARTDQLLMGFIATQAALGVYVVAVNTSETLLILPDAVAVALLTSLARANAASRPELALRTFRVVGSVSVVATLVAGACAPLLLPAVFGHGYRASVTPFLWLIAGTIGFVASQVFGKALLAASSPGFASIAPVASLVLGTALDFALIPPLGATGAAVAATASFATGGVASFLLYRRRETFPYRLLVPTRADFTFARSLFGRTVATADRRVQSRA